MSQADIVRAGEQPSREAPGRAASKWGRPFLMQAHLVALLVGVNAMAIYGQASWFHQHLSPHAQPGDYGSWVPAIGVALVVEAIGVYLAGMAHAARMNDQYPGFLQLGAYGVGLLAGTLNYWHYAPDWLLNAQAVTFGALSTLSPWLWSIYSRHVNRARLLANPRPPSRRFWHPIKFLKVTSYAAWEGITDLDEATRYWELQQDAPDDPRPVSGGSRPRTPVEWTTAAEEIKTANPDMTWKQVAGKLGISDTYLRKMRGLATQEAS